MNPSHPLETAKVFSEEEKKGVYRAIYERRDIRREFLPQPVPDEILKKILDAAHHSGSVGFMQPWNFIVIRDPAVKNKVKAFFEEENEKAAQKYKGERREQYRALKLEGILESPVNLCITCDHERGGQVLGRNTIPETDLYSTCCAIQNLWLAARAEEIGVGWVSILSPGKLKEILGIPSGVTAVAYLCLGYVREFPKKPMLEETGWGKRVPLADLIFNDHWGRRPEMP